MTQDDRDKKALGQPIAIVGIGCMFPQANDSADYWANIRDGIDSITDIPETHWKVGDYFDDDAAAPDMTYGRRGGFIDSYAFNPLEWGIAPKDIEATDTSQLLGMVIAKQALDDAGYGSGGKAFDRDRASVILGVTGTLELVIPLGARLGHPIWRRALDQAGVDAATADDVVDRIRDSYVGWQENSFPGLLGNVVAGRVASRLDFNGTNCVVDAACASTFGALHLAVLELQSGHTDMVVTGGFDTFNDIFMYMCFSKTPALSPSGDARPFSDKADGTILGEGLGAVVLKTLDKAERDGDRIYAVIRGVGTSSDGRGSAVFAPSSEGQTRALKSAYRAADVTPDTIGLIEAHGTGTKIGDAVEIRALTSVFRETQPAGSWCALGSVKSMIGHTKAAAGAAGLIKAALALHHKVLPPTLKIDQPSDAVAPGSTPFFVNTEGRPWMGTSDHPRRAGVSAFGFGGSNFHCVLEEYGAEKPLIDWSGSVQILSFSADSIDDLVKQLDDLPEATAWKVVRGEAARTRERFDASKDYRLSIVVERHGTAATELIALAKDLLEKRPTEERWAAPQGIFFGSGEQTGKLAVIFPGQGAQYPGMLKDLACLFPQFLDVLTTADGCFDGEKRLSDLIYPQPAFDDASRGLQQEVLRATDVAQPAIGAVSLGALRVLEYFGLKAEAAAGHSYGELVALCAAGRIEPDDFHRLSRTRGELMAGRKGDAGSMIAITADMKTVEAFLADHDLGLVIANRNSPRQMVLSGPTAEIDRAESLLEEAGFSGKRLKVAAAFHSELMTHATEAFGEALADVEFGEARLPVYANTTAEPYPEQQEAERWLLAGQLTAPVEFARSVENIFASGVRTFVEIGPGARLSALVEETLAGRDVVTTAIDASSGRRNGQADLARTLAQLAARGVELSLTRWDEGALAEYDAFLALKKPALTIRVNGANAKPSAQTRPATKRMPSPVPVETVTTIAAPVTGRLDSSRNSLEALVRLQEQTARVHQQFLEGQDQATKVIQTLIQQQHGVFEPVVAVHAPQPVLAPQPVIAPQPAAVESDRGRVEQVLLAVVAEKTGYPVEMLELTMGLDGDLGIDSIKRVEILSALEEQLPEAPAIKSDHLGELQTLEQIVQFLVGQGATADVAPGLAETASVAGPAREQISGTLLEVIADKTGYPVEMLDLTMGLDGDLGIDSIKRVEILAALEERLPDAPTIKADRLGELQTLEQIVEFLAGQPVAAANPAPAIADAAPQEAPAAVERYVVKSKTLTADPQGYSLSLAQDGVVWVTASGDGLSRAIVARLRTHDVKAEEIDMATPPSALPERLAGLLLVSPGESTDELLLEAFRLVRHVAPALERAGADGAALLAGVSRLDGSFGFDELKPESSVMSGGMAGLIKTAEREWKGVTCRAFDLDLAVRDDAWAARQIVDRLTVTGPVEIGIARAGVSSIVLKAEQVPEAGNLPLGPEDLVVITGGARGVTAETAVALARAARPRFALLGRSPVPTEEPGWLSAVNDEAEIKRAIAAHAGGSLKPRELESEYKRRTANREILNTLARIEAAGSQVVYCQVDVRDWAAVAGVLHTVTEEFGPITGFIHGAGVLADSRIDQKTDEEYTRVFETKVSGLRSLLAALDGAPLKVLVLFSSSTARFGRLGQADYAIANEIMNKVAQQQSTIRPNCRVVSLNWGPWDGGMVTPALSRLFAQEGIRVIDLEAGARYLLDELSVKGGPTEVVILGQGSDLPANITVERPAEDQAAIVQPDYPVAFERSLDTRSHSFLRSHVINGKAVLPVAMMIEWMAHGALHGNPGLRFTGFDELRVFKGVTLDDAAETRLRIHAGKAIKRGDDFEVPVEIRSAAAGGQGVLHAGATLLLSSTLPVAGDATAEPALQATQRSIDSMYSEMLFHGPDFHGLTQVDGCGDAGITALGVNAPAPTAWIDNPPRGRWIADPLLLDCAFQMMVLWSFLQREHGSLPTAVGEYRQYRKSFPSGKTRIVARITGGHDHQVLSDIEWLDEKGRLVARMRGCDSVIDESLDEAFRRNRLEAEVATGR